jgi:hypothetical protein
MGEKGETGVPALLAYRISWYEALLTYRPAPHPPSYLFSI